MIKLITNPYIWGIYTVRLYLKINLYSFCLCYCFPLYKKLVDAMIWSSQNLRFTNPTKRTNPDSDIVEDLNQGL